MAINPSAITTVSITDPDVPAIITMLASQPSTSEVLSVARTPGELCGYYNGSTDLVELYVVANSGLRFVRIG